MMVIKQINKNDAQNFFEQYEHLGNCGLGVWHYGLFDNNELISVVSFGATNFNPNRSYFGKVAKKYGLKIIQLTRGGTKFGAFKNIPSYTIKRAFKEIKMRFGDCIIIAYSDTRWNEIGTIYQASNFLYCGLTKPKGQSNYKINGKLLSGWTVRKKYGTREMKQLCNLFDNVIRLPLTEKHFYLYINSSKMKRCLLLKEFHDIVKTYPKRKDLNIGSMIDIHKRLYKQPCKWQ